MISEATLDLDAGDTGALLLEVIARVKEGDFAARMPLDWTGVPGKVADGLNDVIIANQLLERELARVPCDGHDLRHEECKLGEAAAFSLEIRGVWKEVIESMNLMAGNLTGQVRNIAAVTTAVANGDLSSRHGARPHAAGQHRSPR